MALNSYTKVQISLPSEDNKKPHELPCVIGVVANLYGNSKDVKRKTLFEREFIHANSSSFDTFNQVIEVINPRIFIEVDDLCAQKNEKKTSAKLDVDLSFASIEDFLPGSIIDRVPKLKILFENMNLVDNILNSTEGITECCDFLKSSWPVRHESQKKEYPPDYVNPNLSHAEPTPFALVEAELEDLLDFMGRSEYSNYPGEYEKENGEIDFKNIVTIVLARIIACMQRLLENQINKIIREPEFKRLETSVFGLKKLFDTIKQNNSKKNVVLRILPASWSEITEDMQRAPIIERSHIFRKVFGELDMPGGIPFNFVVFDFEISHKVSKESGVSFIETLDGLSQIASAAFCPFSFSALPELLGVATFDDFSPFIKLKDLFSLPDYAAWAEFRKKIDTRFINVIIPSVLERLPHNESFDIQPAVTRRDCRIGTVVRPNFYFVEEIHTADDFTWGNAGYSLACVLVRSFDKTGWFEHIRGISKTEDGIDGTIPNVVFGSDTINIPQLYDTQQSQIRPAFGTRFFVSQKIDQTLDDCGFIPVASHPRHLSGVFFHMSSIYDSGLNMNNLEQWANARLASSLHYILSGSRFSHYIKVIGRNMVGKLTSAKKLKDYFDDWLYNYTVQIKDESLLNKNSLEMEAPLTFSEVRVAESTLKPGFYNINIILIPKFSSETLATKIEFVSEIKKSI